MHIFTIGYEGANIASVLNALLENNVQTLVDVRLTPLSRKAGFSKTALSEHLQSVGIDYVHFKQLGCPNPIRNQYKIDSDWNKYTKAYKRYLATQDDSVLDLTGLSFSSNCCLLCFERDASFCHRSFVANRICELSNGLIERQDIRPLLSSSTVVQTNPLFPGLVYL